MIFASCPICNSPDTKYYFTLRCNGLQARYCRKCSHVYIDNSPITTENIAEYYTMDDFKGDRQLQNQSWYGEYYRECFVDYEKYSHTSPVLLQFRDKLSLLGKLLPLKGRLLDVGCATGVFLDMARKDGWEVVGIETSADLATYANENFGLEVHRVDVTREMPAIDQVDVITLFDVIEHIPEPDKMIASCAKLLKPGGYILLRTPDERGLMRGMAKLLFNLSLRRFDYPMLWFYSFEHIQSFSLRSLQHLLESGGFKVTNVIHENESMARLTIPGVVKLCIMAFNALESVLRRNHKIVVIARL